MHLVFQIEKHCCISGQVRLWHLELSFYSFSHWPLQGHFYISLVKISLQKSPDMSTRDDESQICLLNGSHQWMDDCIAIVIMGNHQSVGKCKGWFSRTLSTSCSQAIWGSGDAVWDRGHPGSLGLLWFLHSVELLVHHQLLFRWFSRKQPLSPVLTWPSMKTSLPLSHVPQPTCLDHTSISLCDWNLSKHICLYRGTFCWPWKMEAFKCRCHVFNRQGLWP